jgi:hypothetical protein
MLQMQKSYSSDSTEILGPGITKIPGLEKYCMIGASGRLEKHIDVIIKTVSI